MSKDCSQELLKQRRERKVCHRDCALNPCPDPSLISFTIPHMHFATCKGQGCKAWDVAWSSSNTSLTLPLTMAESQAGRRSYYLPPQILPYVSGYNSIARSNFTTWRTYVALQQKERSVASKGRQAEVAKPFATETRPTDRLHKKVWWKLTFLCLSQNQSIRN